MDMSEWVGEKVKVSLSNNKFYYKGTVLSVGEDFIKVRDFKDTIVLISIDKISIIEGWGG